MGETVQADGIGSVGHDEEVELEVSELEAVERVERRPTGRASAPPPVPVQARGSSPPRSRSGTWRIERPVEGASAAEREAPAAGRVEALEQQSREHKALIARLRLGVQLRDDRIAALEAELARVRKRADELERLEAQRPPDDLKRIDGIGPAYERSLRELGVRRIADIASWGDADVERIAAALGTQAARVQPWIERAAALS